jgi:hypothetical protein
MRLTRNDGNHLVPQSRGIRPGVEGRAYDDRDTVENVDRHEFLSGANLSRIMPPCNAVSAKEFA